MLFTSDEELVRRQQQAKRFPKGLEMSVDSQLRTQVEDSRELREHQRWREFAWLLFVAPIWMAFLLWGVEWLIRKLASGGT